MTAHTDQRTAERSAEAGHELTDVEVQPVIVVGTGIVVATAVIALLMVVLLGFYLSQRSQESPAASPLAGAYGRQQPPEPRLQTDPRADLEGLRAAEHATLTTYGWVDQGAGVVRLPIDRAIALLLERGLPVRPDAGAEAQP